MDMADGVEIKGFQEQNAYSVYVLEATSKSCFWRSHITKLLRQVKKVYCYCCSFFLLERQILDSLLVDTLNKLVQIAASATEWKFEGSQQPNKFGYEITALNTNKGWPPREGQRVRVLKIEWV